MSFTDKNNNEYVDQLLNSLLPKQDPIVEEFTYDIDGAFNALEEEARKKKKKEEYYQKYYASSRGETESYMLPDNFDNDDQKIKTI